MRRVLGGALALMLAWAPAAPTASAQVLDNALARLSCEALAEPPAVPGRRATRAQLEAAVTEFNAWIERRNQSFGCYGAAVGAMAGTEQRLVDEYNRQNAEALAAQQAWVAAQTARAGGRTP